MHYISRQIVVLLTIACVASVLRAQETDASLNLRLAQSFEQSGDWERAIALYEGLYRSEPDNYVYFDGLRRGYTQLRAYDKAISLVEHRLNMQPTDIGLRASLGGLYYESGSEQKADSLWNHLIETNPKNPGMYRIVASQMMDHRLFEQAVYIYRAGRTATHNENAFTDELASLYTLLQQYTDASSEFIKLLKTSPQQLPFIENRIASFTIRKEGLQAATDIVGEEAKKEPENITLRKLFAWVAMEGRDYQTALEQYHAIDRLAKSNGAELLDFARRASQERYFRIATQAFQDIIEISQNPTIVSLARFGYARSMEDLSTEADSAIAKNPPEVTVTGDIPPVRVSETEKSFQGILRLYDAMIKDYSGSDLAAESLYRIGMIRKNRFFDLNGALDAFRQVKQSARSAELKCNASQRIAEVFVLQNNLVSARDEYQFLQRATLPVYQQQAQFRTAELDYFEGKFDSSLAELKPFITNLGSDLSNDALLLQYFITENNTSNPAALAEYAKADLLMRQQKYAEALSQFEEVVRRNPTSLLVDDATLKTGELHLLLNQVNEALTAFQHIVNDMPESILRDHAQMRIAEIYQSITKDKDKAIAAYEQILAKFPNSLYMVEARKRIRQLRGDSI